MLERIEEGKKNIRPTLSPQQLAEANNRAAGWLKNSKKHSGSAGGSQLRTVGQELRAV